MRSNPRSRPYEETRDYQREWREKNADKMRESRFKSSIKRHGITVDRYYEMLEEQQGCCAVCGTEVLTVNRTRMMIDHDHSCCPGKLSCGECIRGLLCGNCNSGMGHFRDDPNILRKAAAYLEAYS